jgi:anti-anti-sigma regulatory factor
MLRITPHAAADEYVLKLEGCLAGAWVPELATCWHETTAASNPKLLVDLNDVCHVDDAGRELLTRMYRAGVRFVASGFVIPELVREIAEVVDRQSRS